MNEPATRAIDPALLRSNPPVNLTLKEAATYIGISPRKLWNETCAGNVRVARVGRRLIIKRAEIDRWLDLLAAQGAA